MIGARKRPKNGADFAPEIFFARHVFAENPGVFSQMQTRFFAKADLQSWYADKQRGNADLQSSDAVRQIDDADPRRSPRSDHSLEAEAKRRNYNPVQLALAWLQKSPVEENMAAAKIQLSPEEWKKIEGAG